MVRGDMSFFISKIATGMETHFDYFWLDFNFFIGLLVEYFYSWWQYRLILERLHMALEGKACCE